MKKPREFWITQTTISYFVGEPVYRAMDLQPSEFDKRTAAAIFHVRVVQEPDPIPRLIEAYKTMWEALRECICNEPISTEAFADRCEQAAREALEKVSKLGGER